MPATTPYKHETPTAFKRRQAKRKGLKHPRLERGHYPGSTKRRSQIRKNIRSYAKGASKGDIRSRVQKLRKGYTVPGQAEAKPGSGTESTRKANIRVKIRALLGRQAAAHGVGPKKTPPGKLPLGEAPGRRVGQYRKAGQTAPPPPGFAKKKKPPKFGKKA